MFTIATETKIEQVSISSSMLIPCVTIMETIQPDPVHERPAPLCSPGPLRVLESLPSPVLLWRRSHPIPETKKARSIHVLPCQNWSLNAKKGEMLGPCRQETKVLILMSWATPGNKEASCEPCVNTEHVTWGSCKTQDLGEWQTLGFGYSYDEKTGNIPF